jgi:hypothetical protein
VSNDQPAVQPDIPYFDDIFLKKMLGGQLESPVVKLSENKFALGYDEIRVTGDGQGGVKWQIIYKGMLLSEQSVGPAKFDEGQTLSLSGIVGLTQATVQS